MYVPERRELPNRTVLVFVEDVPLRHRRTTIVSYGTRGSSSDSIQDPCLCCSNPNKPVREQRTDSRTSHLSTIERHTTVHRLLRPRVIFGGLPGVDSSLPNHSTTKTLLPNHYTLVFWILDLSILVSRNPNLPCWNRESGLRKL